MSRNSPRRVVSYMRTCAGPCTIGVVACCAKPLAIHCWVSDAALVLRRPGVRGFCNAKALTLSDTWHNNSSSSSSSSGSGTVEDFMVGCGMLVLLWVDVCDNLDGGCTVDRRWVMVEWWRIGKQKGFAWRRQLHGVSVVGSRSNNHERIEITG